MCEGLTFSNRASTIKSRWALLVYASDPVVSEMKNILTTGLAIAVVMMCPLTAGETVVMENGRRVEGAVTEQGDMVRINTSEGTYTINKARIARIIHADSRQTVRTENRKESGALPATVQHALRKKISVNFRDAEMTEVLSYLREKSDLNIVYLSGDKDTIGPVNFQLKKVPFYRVLNILCELESMNWAVQEDIVKLGDRKFQTNVVRAYDIRDLLVNIEGHYPGEGASHAQNTTDDAAGQNSWQWGENGDSDDRTNAFSNQPLSGRVRDLSLLISSTVRPDQWDDPAVRVIGGSEDE